MTARELRKACNNNVGIKWFHKGLGNNEIIPLTILKEQGQEEVDKFWNSNIYMIFPSTEERFDLEVSVYY